MITLTFVAPSKRSESRGLKLNFLFVSLGPSATLGATIGFCFAFKTLHNPNTPQFPHNPNIPNHPAIC